MNSSYHTSCTENGHRRSDSGRQTRHSSDKYDSHHRQTTSSRTQEREKDISSKDSAYSSSNLLINRDEIVLSYPEKPIPAKEPVISLDIEDDEERIMQADWGNESDDEEDHATMHKQHKRLSTVEREEIERADRESKGLWVKHTAEDGRPYYYNSVTRESVWEIPKSTTVTSVATSAPSNSSTRTASVATNTHTTTKHASSTRSDGSHKKPNDTLSKQSQSRSNSAPSASTSSKETPKATAVKRHRDCAKEKDDTKDQVRTKKNDVCKGTNTNEDKGQRSKSTQMTVQSSERRSSYHSREVSREKRSRLEMVSHRGYSSRRSRSRSPLPPPPPRDLYYDDYRYHHRSPSPPPYRHYPPYERYGGYYPYDDRIRHSPPPPPPDLRYRYYELSPPPPMSPPPYYRSRERSWERYEAVHRSRYYR